MGNRVNYGFKNAGPDGEVFYLYLHWGVDPVEAPLANALDKTRARWDDTAYCIRWTVLNLMDANGDLDPTSETGSGFTVNTLCDNEYDVWEVDFPARVVTDGDHVYSISEFVEKYKD